MKHAEPDPNPIPVQKTAFVARIIWLVLLAAGVVMEVFGLVHPGKGDTLSETTAWLWQADTTVGAWVWGVAWTAFAIWFGPHIVKINRQRKARKEAQGGE